jgi:P27 family predicted phage terminase small subunit
MGRGRRAVPDEIKALKGNPGKRKLAFNPNNDQPSAKEKPTLAIPEFLVHEREREIFRRVVEDYLQRRIARSPDLTAYARWASYLHRWIKCKEELEGKSAWYKSSSKHGDMFRRHPLFKDMIDIERLLQSLEDRLGLNPTSRQNIIRGLSTMPAALGGLFGGDEPAENQPKSIDEIQGEDAPVVSPLGYLQSARSADTKPH